MCGGRLFGCYRESVGCLVVVFGVVVVCSRKKSGMFFCIFNGLFIVG